MKKLTYILAAFFGLSVLVGCQKETTISTEDPRTDYFYSLKGEKHAHVKVEIYKISEEDEGTCAGYFIKPISEHFDFIIEINQGMPDDILNAEDLEGMSFEVDFTFTGIAYNCNKAYKKPGSGNGHPVEIQQVEVTRYIVNQ